MSASRRTESTEIKNAVRANVSALGDAEAEIYVARDRGDLWRVRVVTDVFTGLSGEQRQAAALAGVEHAIGESQLLTTPESPWYGPPFPEVEGPVPIWPEVLEQRSDNLLLFASDLDEDLHRPAVVTFYSLKGGVGRTTAVAAAARILASRGESVLAIDMDLEAPGLSHHLGLPEPGHEQGVLSLLLALGVGDDVDIRDHVQRVSDADELYCLPRRNTGPGVRAAAAADGPRGLVQRGSEPAPRPARRCRNLLHSPGRNLARRTYGDFLR